MNATYKMGRIVANMEEYVASLELQRMSCLDMAADFAAGVNSIESRCLKQKAELIHRCIKEIETWIHRIRECQQRELF